MVFWVILYQFIHFFMETVFTVEQKIRHSRIKRVKKLLRYMPRRATLHKYPFLKYFANFTRKRSYLWSFHSREVISAIYIGCITAFMPLPFVHLPLAFALALIFRGNLMITFALQLICNPATVGFIYGCDYLLGNKILDLFGDAFQQPIIDGYTMETGLKLGRHALKGFRIALSFMLGGIIIGYGFGLLFNILYWMGIKRFRANSGRQPAPQTTKIPNQ